VKSDRPTAKAACPVCCASELAECPSGRDRLFGIAPGLFSLFRCQSCGCVFQDPIPEMSVLSKLYPQQYWWSEEGSESSGCALLFRKMEKLYREFVTKDHVRFLNACARGKPRRTLLDIGCGNGTFLHIARSRGFLPHGMDVSARAAEIANKQYGIPVRQGELGSKAWDGSRFDFVTMFHVLEHLPDPKSALLWARDLLEPDGTLIIQVPNISSVQARLFGTHWYGLDVPRHVINYTPQALGLLLREAAFEFRLTSRFSLRDNPASIASSLALRLDPIHRQGAGLKSSPARSGAMELAYFGLFLLSIPPAFIESAFGFGGTIWASATVRKP
jgi:2-polyprenyl-3-methyl-5-hydroxy-6-metoxy-1,4-benzoquinol methylase